MAELEGLRLAGGEGCKAGSEAGEVEEVKLEGGGAGGEAGGRVEVGVGGEAGGEAAGRLEVRLEMRLEVRLEARLVRLQAGWR